MVIARPWLELLPRMVLGAAWLLGRVEATVYLKKGRGTT
jgi:hypothetical protein